MSTSSTLAAHRFGAPMNFDGWIEAHRQRRRRDTGLSGTPFGVRACDPALVTIEEGQGHRDPHDDAARAAPGAARLVPAVEAVL